jgi:hypothetical protein
LNTTPAAANAASGATQVYWTGFPLINREALAFPMMENAGPGLKSTQDPDGPETQKLSVSTRHGQLGFLIPEMYVMRARVPCAERP